MNNQNILNHNQYKNQDNQRINYQQNNLIQYDGQNYANSNIQIDGIQNIRGNINQIQNNAENNYSNLQNESSRQFHDHNIQNQNNAEFLQNQETQQNLNEKIKRVKNARISIPIVIGSVAQLLKKSIPFQITELFLTHKWCCYVRGLRENSQFDDPMEEQDLSFLIQKVEFSIHESFPQYFISIDKPPFEIHNAGYGEFPITIKIYFQDPNERPLEYTHQLKIEPEINEGENIKQTQKRQMAPVIHEKYNEITFFEPTESFYSILQKNQFQQYASKFRNEIQNYSLDQRNQILSQNLKKQQEQSDENLGKYQNYLSMNSHKPLFRGSIRDKFAQKDFYQIQEQKDLEKLELAVQYIKELNALKYEELKLIEKEIKERVEKKTVAPGEQYKMHIIKMQEDIQKEHDKSFETVKALQAKINHQQSQFKN